MSAKVFVTSLWSASITSCWWMAGLGWKPVDPPFQFSPWIIPAIVLTIIGAITILSWVTDNWKKP